MKEEPSNDPTLEAVFLIHGQIEKRYSKKPNKKTGRADALAFAKATLEFAKNHPGQFEDSLSGRDAAEIDIEVWGAVIENANNGDWQPMKQRILETSQTFFNSGIDDITGKAFLNLSNSI